MSNIQQIVQTLIDCNINEIEFHPDNLSKSNQTNINSENKNLFLNFLQNNRQLFESEVIYAYLRKVQLNNLERNLNKLQIDSSFILNFTSNWMSYLSATIKSTKPFSNFLLPGTHNSYTREILWSKKPIFLNQLQFGSSKLPGVRSKVKDFVVNQTKTILEQVQAGIRLFDLRIAKDSDQKYYIAHTYYVGELEQCLNEFRQALSIYVNEILVINFKPDYPYRKYFTQNDLISIYQLFSSILGEFILPNNLPVGTISQILGIGKRLIVYCNLEHELFANNNIFNQSNILLRVGRSRELWPNEDKLENLPAKIHECLHEFNKSNSRNEFNYLSFNITPKANITALTSSIIDPSYDDIKKKENYLTNLFSNNSMNNISGIILDNPTFNQIQLVIAQNF